MTTPPAGERAASGPANLPAVAGPLFLELALGIGVGMAGTALAARLGDGAAAAFALANHVVVTLFILFLIVGANHCVRKKGALRCKLINSVHCPSDTSSKGVE